MPNPRKTIENIRFFCAAPNIMNNEQVSICTRGVGKYSDMMLTIGELPCYDISWLKVLVTYTPLLLIKIHHKISNATMINIGICLGESPGLRIETKVLIHIFMHLLLEVFFECSTKCSDDHVRTHSRLDGHITIWIANFRV